MARRRSTSNAERLADDLYVTLLGVPWWVGPILALVAFCFFRFIVPAILGPAGEPFGTVFATLPRTLAPFVALIIGVIWIAAEIKKLSSRTLLDTRRDRESLRSLDWREFERLVGEAYRRQGYAVEETGGGGADGGVDLVLFKNGEKALVQCKQWKAWKVGVKTIRELYGLVVALNATRGVVVTSGRFTREAREFAAGKPLVLVDGPALWKLVEGVKASSPSRAVPLAQPVELSPSPAPSTPTSEIGATTPACPVCGAHMVLRTARKGASAGSQFYGCTRYPRCRGIRQL